MKSYLSFAWKELRAQKVTAVLILIAMTLSTVMTTAIGQSLGVLQDMREEQAARLNGSRYATFYEMTEEQAKNLHEDARLYDVGDWMTVGAAELGDSGLTLYLREYHENALAMYPDLGRVKEGRLPERENEIALPEDVLQYLGLDVSVGDSVTLGLSTVTMDGILPGYGFTADFVLTAVLESNYLGYATGMVAGIAGSGTAGQLLPEEYLLWATDFKTCSKADFQEVVYELAAALGVEERHIQYNWVLLDALGISYDEKEEAAGNTGFPFMTLACMLVGALILLAAGLVIYNILKISVAKRVREYGTLRAMGGEKGQIYRLVSLQLLILCGIGIPVGLLIGSLSAKGILTAALGILNPELFLADSTEELNAAIYSTEGGNMPLLLLSVAVTLVFAMTAAFPAARYAARVSPTVAMSGTGVKVKRQIRKDRRICNFEAYYAGLNLRRGRGRTVITILSLVMSITVYIALQGFTALLDAGSDIKDIHLGDYAVTNETVGIPAEAVRRMEECDLVQSLSTEKLAVYGWGDALPFETDLAVQSHETLQIASLDEERLSSCVPGLSEQDMEEILAGTACLVKNPIEFSYGDMEISYTKLAAGDVITLGGYALRVAGLAENPITTGNGGFINGVQVIVSGEVYDSLTGSDSFSEIYPTLKEGVEAEGFESWMEEWLGDAPGTHWLSYRQSDAQVEDSFEQVRMLCFVLILFVGIIGILNIINTVYSNIHTRVTEIGMQRAIGMSRGSLYRTFLWEGAYYGLIASVAGAALGYVCQIFIEAAGTDTLQLVPVPLGTIARAALLSVAACLAATAIPLRSVVKMSIVESVESVE